MSAIHAAAVVVLCEWLRDILEKREKPFLLGLLQQFIAVLAGELDLA